jgi:short-subunit dehydrogenase
MRALEQQVVVITGASSGIGRETALQLARRRATVVLAARGEEALTEVAREVERLGGTPQVEVTDVGEREQVDALADAAVQRFGRIDTWINNAAVSLYGNSWELDVGDVERVIHVNLLGQVYAMHAALRHMVPAGAGHIVNVASAEAWRGTPLQSAYSAAKAGIKGYTEALRLELAHENTGVQVSLVLPASMNTPLFGHALSALGVKPMGIPPIYEPRVAAETIVFVCEHPRTEVVAGGAGKGLVLGERLSPRMMDRVMLARGGMIFKRQKTQQPDDGADNLYGPLPGAGSTTGELGQKSKSTSPFTRMLELHPGRQRALLGAAAAGVIAAIRR